MDARHWAGRARCPRRRAVLARTRPLFEWSVAANCRFFVRAFDLTAADQKQMYKTRMRTLESRFYQDASPSGPPPFAVAADR